MTTTHAIESAQCACSAALGDLDATTHDRLLSMESGGAAGLAHIVGLAAAQAGSGHLPGELHLEDFAAFVACHNWTDPTAMHLLAHELQTLARAAEVGRRHEDEQLEEQAALDAENGRKAAILMATLRGSVARVAENLSRWERRLDEIEGDDDDQ